MLLEISGEITPERMKGWSQSKNNTQLWMLLVIEAKFDAVKSSIAKEPGITVKYNAAFLVNEFVNLRSLRAEVNQD